MDNLASLVVYLLSGMGLTVLVVWPETGPMALVRDHVLRRYLPSFLVGALDCYICFGFWAGLALSVVWWVWTRHAWCWCGCLMVPALFWMWLTPPSPPTPEPED